MYAEQFDDLYDARQAEDELVYAGFTVHVIRNRLGFAVFAYF
jgi:hypothetical protein